MKQFPFLSTKQFLIILRVSVSLMLVAHGLIRIYAGSVNGFGGFLNEKGFFIGTIIAWGITFFEIVGGLILALGYYLKLICSGFILILISGVLLVHIKNGWFVVGYSTGGMEYSILLILCLLLISTTKK